MDGKENSPDAVAAFDQVGTTLENSAVIFGAYYKKLLDSGIPNELALLMVRDIQAVIFGRLGSK